MSPKGLYNLRIKSLLEKVREKKVGLFASTGIRTLGASA
jgi:hypothetical protein